MTTINVTEARARLPELVDEVSSQLTEYVITKRGRSHAVLLSSDEHDALLETLTVLSDGAVMKRIKESMEELARGETASFEEVFGEPL
jgi:prevent-host-death family protein